MFRESSYKGKFGDWDKLNTMLTANASELAHLEPLRAQLAASLAQGQAQAAQQAVHTAAKQDSSQQLRSTVVEGDRLANLLRKALQQHYGIRSEKLVEFGVKTFRGRVRAAKPTPTPVPTSAQAPDALDRAGDLDAGGPPADARVKSPKPPSSRSGRFDSKGRASARPFFCARSARRAARCLSDSSDASAIDR